MPFEKILIANRGEIACRVIRTARALGYRTVAVWSDADAGAPHASQADEAVRIGEGPAARSYLSIEAILEAARRTGAGAVHPGYGFLSERPAFARACAAAGLVFIGPPAAAIEAMGDKAGAKRRMIAAGVPCVPGFLGQTGDAGDGADAQDERRLTAEAARLGYPLLVKAVAGGGGRGMRLARQASELAAAIEGARREAQSAFGDGALMLERLIERGRHIEIQVFADAHGEVLHLGERDCTAQRRRQKVIEEAPSPVVEAALREAMGRDAVAAARAVGYVGAGTVEFIVAGEPGALGHYFLEMNTRLQVEHPVTECVTGLDLVEWQIRIAAGERLPLRQEDVRFTGHAIEARLYAEDPADGFRPQSGRVRHWRPGRALAPGVRIDHGIAEGGEVTPYYDAMVAKIIAHGRDRDDAIRRLATAIEEAPLLGLANNGRFLRDLVRHPAFRGAAMHTATLDDWAATGEAISKAPAVPEEAWLLAAACRAAGTGRGARPASVAAFDVTLRAGAAPEASTRVMRARLDGDDVVLAADGAEHRVRLLERGEDRVQAYELDGIRRRAVVLDGPGQAITIAIEAAVHVLEEPSSYPSREQAADPRRALAEVAGAVRAVLVAAGEVVTPGQQLVCVEAMKMELWAVAAQGGVVRAVHARVGEQVAQGQLLVELEEPPAPGSLPPPRSPA